LLTNLLGFFWIFLQGLLHGLPEYYWFSKKLTADFSREKSINLELFICGIICCSTNAEKAVKSSNNCLN